MDAPDAASTGGTQRHELPAPPGVAEDAWHAAVREATGLGGSVGHGGWIFSTTLGAARASVKRPCPVCSGTSNCQVSREELGDGQSFGVYAVLCRRVVTHKQGGKPGTRRECADGVVREACKGAKSGGKLWVPVEDGQSGGRVMLPARDAAEVERLAQIVASVAIAKLEVAWRDYQRVQHQRGGGCDAMPVRAYLEGRGIDVSRLPGGVVPMALRFGAPVPDLYEFHGRNRDGTSRAERILDPTTRAPRPVESLKPRRWWKPGAMVAAVVDPVCIALDGNAEAPGTSPSVGRRAWFKGMHVTYLAKDQAGWRKRRRERDERGQVEGEPRQEFGSCDGVIVFPGVSATRKAMFPRGVLIVAEGIETTLSVMSATSGGFTCWAATDLGEIAQVPRLVAGLIDAGGGGGGGGQEISLVVFAVDLDKTESEKKESRTRAGQRGVAAAIAMMGELCPGVTAVPAVMMAGSFPGLVEARKLSQDELEAHAEVEYAADEPWLGGLGVGVFRDEATGELCEWRPAIDGGKKGVDWNDAVRADEGRGLQAAEKYFGKLLGEAVVDSAWRRFQEWKAGREHADPVEPAPPLDQPAIAGDVAASPCPEKNTDTGRERVRTPRTPERADETVSRGEGDEGRVGDGDGGGVGYPGLCWEEFDGDGKKKVCLSSRGIDRSRYWLMSEQLVEGERRFRLAWWASRFWLYDQGRWRVLVDEQVRGMVATWLARYWNRQERGDSVKYVRVDPNERAVTEILAKLAQECGVWGERFERAPFWLPDSVSERGTASWGGHTRPWRLKGDRAEAAGEASDYIGHNTGLIRLSEMIDLARRGSEGAGPAALTEYVHTPDLFTQGTVDYTLPVDELAIACSMGWDDKQFGHLCPTFMGWLDAATANDSKEESALRRRQLAEMVGETLSGNRDAEVVYLVPGPPRSGKGVLEAALTAVMGLDRLQATDFAALGSNFGIADLVGKSCAIMSDAHVTKHTDAGLAVERLKTMSGNGRIRVEAKHREAVTLKINPRIWIMCNDDPSQLQDNSGALAGRFVVWPMLETFRGREDPGVKQGVANEAAGIAVWALSHYAKMRAEGRVRPSMSETGQTRANEIARITSKMAAFIQECAVVDAGIGCAIDNVERRPGRLTVKMSLAYQVYFWWCKEAGVEPVGQNRFKPQLRSLIPRIGESQPKLGDGSRERQYVGISLRADVPEQWVTQPVPIKGAGRPPSAAGGVGGHGNNAAALPPEEQIPF